MAELSDAIMALDKEAVLKLVDQGLSAGQDPLELVDQARDGLEMVGQKFEQGEYFLMELMRAAQIFMAASEILNPAIQEKYGGISAKGTVLLGTVAGDIHDLGKNIVKILLECQGVEVVDLGVDVPVEAFVEKAKEITPDVVGLSALLTASIPQMRDTVLAIEAAGLREKMKLIVGGGIVGEVELSEVNADHATTDANEGVSVIMDWIA
jgi:dimethylamine corrinoid protein